MKDDLIVDMALERLLGNSDSLEESWQEKRKHTRTIVGHTYAQNLRIVRERGSRETNNLLNLMLVDMPEELRKFIDEFYPELCLPVEDFRLDHNFNAGSFIKLERLKRKKPLAYFGKYYWSVKRMEKSHAPRKVSLKMLIRLLEKLNFRLVIEEETKRLAS
jgi:hypothetical protein